MEAKTNYTIVGLAVLILTTALIIASLWLSVGFDQKKYNIYAVYMHEAASGLSDDAPVKYNGVQVGTVRKIELNPVDPQQVRLLLNIVEGTPITKSTTATLISQGITGNSYVGLSASSSDLTPLEKLPQEPYPIIPAKPSLFNQLDRVLKEVSQNVNSVSIEVKKVFSPENAANLKKSLTHIESFTHVLAKNDKNINIMLANLAKTSKDLPSLIRDLKTGVRRFNAMAVDMGMAGRKLSSTMDSGKLAIEKIAQETIPPATSLLHRLENIAANLEKVSNEMRQNPSVIIRGKAPPKAGPGE